MMRFRLKIDPPTATAQMQAKSKIFGALQQYIPEEPLKGPLFMSVIWNFPTNNSNRINGEWMDAKPNINSLQQILKDCMTQAGFLDDDAQVVFEVVQKHLVKYSPCILVNLMTVKEYEEQIWRRADEAETGV